MNEECWNNIWSCPRLRYTAAAAVLAAQKTARLCVYSYTPTDVPTRTQAHTYNTPNVHTCMSMCIHMYLHT